VILSFDADSTRAAMEGTGRSNDHTGSTQGQGVSVLVWVDDESILEAVITVEVGQPIAIIGSLSLCLVLDVDAVCGSLGPNRVAIFAGDRRDDARLRVGALVDQSQQVQNAK